MKTNYKIIFPLMVILFAFSHCTREDKNDPCILTAKIRVKQTNTVLVEITNGVPPYSYSWSTSETTAEITGNPLPNVYSVTIIDALACTATDKVDSCKNFSVQLEVDDEFPDLSEEIKATASGGLPPYTYKWTFGTVIISDNYTSRYAGAGETVLVEVTDSRGCDTIAAYTNPCPCQHGGTCVDGICDCPLDYTGDSCQFACRGCTFCGADTIVTDAEGNVYATVSIGNQCWMAENLRVSAGIPEETDGTQWANLTTPAWCYHGNNSSNGVLYGKLYNWYAVNTGSLCPGGWHIPTDAEWQNLVDYLGGNAVAGGAMKDTTGWDAPNTGATNSSGFTALPGGGRSFSGNFYGIGNAAEFWTSTELNTDHGWGRELSYNNSDVYLSNLYKVYGESCRCVKD